MIHIPKTSSNFKKRISLVLDDGKTFYGANKRECIASVREFLAKNPNYDISSMVRKWCSGCKEDHPLKDFCIQKSGMYVALCRKASNIRTQKEYLKRKIKYAEIDAELERQIREMKY